MNPNSQRKIRMSCWVVVVMALMPGCQVAEKASHSIAPLVARGSELEKFAKSTKRKQQLGANEVSNGVKGIHEIKQVSYQEGLIESAAPPEIDDVVHSDRYPVDLAMVLKLAGADNWNVRIAREQICEAVANLNLAEAAILPSLNLGVIYNVHDGEIQQTDGTVITASRNSLFVGGGAGIANSPLNGGSGGPARMFVDFSVADALFKPLAARRRVHAARANNCRVLNDTLLEATLAYYELVRGQSLLAIALENLNEAQQVASLTEAFVDGGKGSQADVHRVNVIVNERRQNVVAAKAAIEVASAKLAEVLQLDPCEADPEIGLFALESQPFAIDIIDWAIDLNAYIDMAQSTRCEVSQALAEAHARNADHEAEVWRSRLPNLFLGYSGGGFGGGPGGGLTGIDWRNDFDVGVTWQIKNLGLGNKALQKRTCSQYRQQVFEARRVRDQVSQQVSTTYNTTQRYQKEMELYRVNIVQSRDALAKNIEAIRGLEGLPLEAVQSLNAAADSRLNYLNSVVNYNQWQLRMLRATGQPFAEGGCGSESCQCCNLCKKCTSLPGTDCCDCSSNGCCECER